MDELALAAGSESIEFRLPHLEDPHARAVVDAAATAANWRCGVRGTGPRKQSRAQGLGFAQYRNAMCYVAVIFDVSVDVPSGQIRLEHATIAGDAGQIINPDGLAKHPEGGGCRPPAGRSKSRYTTAPTASRAVTGIPTRSCASSTFLSSPFNFSIGRARLVSAVSLPGGLRLRPSSTRSSTRWVCDYVRCLLRRTASVRLWRNDNCDALGIEFRTALIGVNPDES